MSDELPMRPASTEAARNDPEYIAYLEERIALLESRMPKTALLSPSFMTRAFAVVGHYLVAGLLIEVVIVAVLGLFSLVASGCSAALGN